MSVLEWLMSAYVKWMMSFRFICNKIVFLRLVYQILSISLNRETKQYQQNQESARNGAGSPHYWRHEITAKTERKHLLFLCRLRRLSMADMISLQLRHWEHPGHCHFCCSAIIRKCIQEAGKTVQHITRMELLRNSMCNTARRTPVNLE